MTNWLRERCCCVLLYDFGGFSVLVVDQIIKIYEFKLICFKKGVFFD